MSIIENISLLQEYGFEGLDQEEAKNLNEDMVGIKITVGELKEEHETKLKEVEGEVLGLSLENIALRGSISEREQQLQAENEKLKAVLRDMRICEACSHYHSGSGKGLIKYCKRCNEDNNNWEWKGGN